jgi:16S rRNA (cytosine967-C5)-methyltransferase
MGVRASAPDWLVQLAVRQNDAPEELLQSFNTPAPMWLRANTLRISAAELAKRLKTTRVEDDALRAEGLGDPAQAQEFAEGLFTVQDLAAQRVARLVDPQPGETILDACAGVGGKSTHLAALAQDRAIIDAADLSERKLDLGAESARRLGVKSMRAVVCDLTDPNAPLQQEYDRVLLDAPCTGLGVLRRHPEAKWRRQPGDAVELAELQAQILQAIAPRVKQLLVYSVCTFTDEEGPRQIERFLAGNPQFAVEGETLRTWPHRDDADAFFAVKLRRMR